ncbi:hypothetical protein K788_0001395 (plasmid) [Paraburkholderia caribensis MBA4]|uniref:Uncharacterized protein n=1 Tax=Paraburkholderia caribensis MBA4 TaxID=1323664 RepID=A0A0P0RMW7_9BURK|nr:hypothetical protein [Paraburkholderia caribensis]ALL70263.1 hypothetical protein K788_0001395 [Paraburkholderia caribensis MBA4]
MATYAIERQALQQVANVLAGRFDWDAHIAGHESNERAFVGLTVSNPRGPDTPAILLRFQHDVLDRYDGLTEAAQAEFSARCNAKLVGALLIYERIHAAGELGSPQVYVIEFGEELL